MAAIDKHFGHPAHMPRAGLPDEIGPVVAFLASRRNSYMTGANINVDGGSDFTVRSELWRLPRKLARGHMQRCAESATASTRRSAVTTATTSTGTHTERWCATASGSCDHPMLWCTSGIAEFWSLTLDERKRLLEVAIEEGRAADPDVVVQACTAAMSAKDCLELTRHAEQAGADIVYIQTPMMEAHGGEGVLTVFPIHRRPHRHRAGHVQLAVVGVRVDSRRKRTHLRRDPRRLRHQGGRVPARERAGCCTSSRPNW